MNTLRTQTYVDYRGHSDATNNNGIAELQGLYTELSALGIDVNAGNLNQYFTDTIIPELSSTLNVNSGLIKTLLNQITSYEQFYANVDDARAQGFKPTITNNLLYYNQIIPIRTLAYASTLPYT